MRIESYEYVEDFIRENYKELSAKEVINNLILKNAYIHRKEKTCKELLFGKVCGDEGGTEILFCNVHPFNLIFNSTDKYGKTEAVELLTDYIVSNGIEIKGINSNKINCSIFLKAFKVPNNMVFRKRLYLDLMELRNINDIEIVKGRWRFPCPEDENLITDWAAKFRIEATHETDNNLDFIRKDMRERIKKNVIFLYENENNKPVSMAIVAAD